jgi:ribosomal protein L13E
MILGHEVISGGRWVPELLPYVRAMYEHAAETSEVVNRPPVLVRLKRRAKERERAGRTLAEVAAAKGTNLQTARECGVDDDTQD